MKRFLLKTLSAALVAGAAAWSLPAQASIEILANGVGVGDTATQLTFARFDTLEAGQAQGYRLATLADARKLFVDRAGAANVAADGSYSLSLGTALTPRDARYDSTPLSVAEGLGTTMKSSYSYRPTGPSGPEPWTNIYQSNAVGLRVSATGGGFTSVLFEWQAFSSAVEFAISEAAYIDTANLVGPGTYRSEYFDANGQVITSGYLMVKSGPVALVPGVTVDRKTVDVPNTGAPSTALQVKLSNAPLSDVTIWADPPIGGSSIVPSPASVTFTPSNWNLPQAVSFTGPVGQTTNVSADFLLHSHAMSPAIKPTTVTATEVSVLAGGCSVAYKVTSSWKTGFAAQVTVSNQTSAALKDWNVTWFYYFNPKLSLIWNAKLAWTPDGGLSATPTAFNRGIPAKGSVTFGFIGTRTPQDDPTVAAGLKWPGRNCAISMQ